MIYGKFYGNGLSVRNDICMPMIFLQLEISLNSETFENFQRFARHFLWYMYMHQCTFASRLSQ